MDGYIYVCIGTRTRRDMRAPSWRYPKALSLPRSPATHASWLRLLYARRGSGKEPRHSLRARISTNWSRPAGRRHACATGRGLALGGGGAAGGRGRHAARATRLRPAARRDAQGSARQRALIYGSRPWARRHEWPSWHAARPAVAAIVPAHGFSRVVGVGSYTSWDLQTE